MGRAGLRIGEIAGRAGVSCDTVRHYERLGLLPRAIRTASGYRQYSESAVDRIRLVRCAVRFGFSLKQIAGFLRVRDNGGAPCHQVRDAGVRMLEAADREIAELVATREAMRQTLAAWDDRIARTPEGRPARLLDAIPQAFESVMSLRPLGRSRSPGRAR